MLHRRRSVRPGSGLLPEGGGATTFPDVGLDVVPARGNALFARGERFEAAKLYEQAVLKFDWYSEAIADEAERQIVLPVKIPCHLNLALMSLQLGNHAHAIVHCTQVCAVCVCVCARDGRGLARGRRV